MAGKVSNLRRFLMLSSEPLKLLFGVSGLALPSIEQLINFFRHLYTLLLPQSTLCPVL